MRQLNPDGSLGILHPRPSPIAAAMYTMRDLGIEVIVLHGPAGCNFRAARLLERDGVAIVTTALDQNAVIFGAEDNLVRTLNTVHDTFSPASVGVIGTCCAAIIGEDLQRAADVAGLPCPVLVVDCDPYNHDNVDGAIRTLGAAERAGMISPDECGRQCAALRAATLDEHARGTARGGYMPLSHGNPLSDAAGMLSSVYAAGTPVAIVLNAKKETSLLYADAVIGAVSMHRRLCSSSPLTILANIDNTVGLPLIRGYADAIRAAYADSGVTVHHVTGGLDEYPFSGKRAADIVNKAADAWGCVMVCGLPHAVPLDPAIPSLAVATGARAIHALRECGYDIVIDEEKAHYSVLGARRVVPAQV